jgi:hypothetical protein
LSGYACLLQRALGVVAGRDGSAADPNHSISKRAEVANASLVRSQWRRDHLIGGRRAFERQKEGRPATKFFETRLFGPCGGHEGRCKRACSPPAT